MPVSSLSQVLLLFLSKEISGEHQDKLENENQVCGQVNESSNYLLEKVPLSSSYTFSPVSFVSRSRQIAYATVPAATPHASSHALSCSLHLNWKENLEKCVDASPLVIVFAQSGFAHREEQMRYAKKRKDLPREERGIVQRRKKEINNLHLTERIQNQENIFKERKHILSNEESLRQSKEIQDGRKIKSNCEGNTSRSVSEREEESKKEGSKLVGVVYTGSHSGCFKAIDIETGHVLWLRTLKGRIESSATASITGQGISFE